LQDEIPKRVIYVLANPFGGQKKALSIIATQVEPVFAAANITMQLEGRKNKNE
jgi:hypothetical protein